MTYIICVFKGIILNMTFFDSVLTASSNALSNSIPYNATQIILNLQDEGLTMIPFGQGFKDMSPPTKELYSLVLKEKIIHNNHPVLRWNFDNVCVETDSAENIKLSKKHSTERIDGAVAAVMALDRAVRNGGQQGSVYDSRGIIVF